MNFRNSHFCHYAVSALQLFKIIAYGIKNNPVPRKAWVNAVGKQFFAVIGVDIARDMHIKAVQGVIIAAFFYGFVKIEQRITRRIGAVVCVLQRTL